MRGVIRVIIVHGARGLVHAHVGHSRVAIQRGEVRAADGAVLIQQKLRAINGTVVVQFLGFFQIANPVVDLASFLVQQCGIEP